MRNTNVKNPNSAIYARIRDVQMSQADRQFAIRALHGAEQFADALLWIRDQFSAVGHLFLKPSLKH